MIEREKLDRLVAETIANKARTLEIGVLEICMIQFAYKRTRGAYLRLDHCMDVETVRRIFKVFALMFPTQSLDDLFSPKNRRALLSPINKLPI